MGSTHSLPAEELSELLEITNFTKEDLKRWYKKFIKDYPDGRLDREQFSELYGRLYKTNFSNHLSVHIFKSLDLNNDGSLSFKELMSALSVTSHGTLRAKLEWLFNVYDLDGNGVISFEEINHMTKCLQAMSQRKPAVVSSCNTESLVTIEQVEDMFETIDVDHSGGWSLEEFIEGMKRYPSFVRMLKLNGGGHGKLCTHFQR